MADRDPWRHTDLDDLDELDEAGIRRERNKARDLRKTRWWQRKTADGRCHYCGVIVGPGALTMDHIVPLSRGGRSTKANLVACCKDCNTRKKTTLPLEWDEYMETMRRAGQTSVEKNLETE